MARASDQPSQTASKLPSKLTTILPPARDHWPDSAKRRVSSENAENVVNPPKMPVVMRSCILPETGARMSSQVPMSPAKKHPITLTHRVGHGNRVLLPRSKVTLYRALAPIAPPAATLINVIKEGIGIVLAFYFRGLYRKNGTTMNRLFICTILLALSSAASAETLYRWTEPDGSITFSPNKPPAGVDYKTVESPGAKNSSISKPSTARPAVARNIQTPITASNAAQIQPAVQSQQQLSYSPDRQSGNANGRQNAAQASRSSVSPQANNVASTQKRGRCVELGKRVVSLERRLRSPLEAQDMDNTVIAMARYQRSYDQFCVE